MKALAESVAKEGIPIAVCSTSNEKAVAQIVDMLGPELSASIQIFAGDVVPKKKPSPDIYNLATEKLKLDPEATVVIEDSHIGLTAAKDAGMKCIVTKVSVKDLHGKNFNLNAEIIAHIDNVSSDQRIQSTYTVNEDFSRADIIVDDLESSNTTIDKLRAIL